MDVGGLNGADEAIRFTRGRRAHVHITGRSGNLVVLVIGEYRGQWRVKRAEYRIFARAASRSARTTHVGPEVGDDVRRPLRGGRVTGVLSERDAAAGRQMRYSARFTRHCPRYSR